MVTVSNYIERTNEKTGEKFYSLQVEGEPIVLKSQKTGNLYITSQKATIPSTFTEAMAKSMLGMKIPGRIIKETCDPYEYTTPKGEVIELSYTFKYSDEKSIEEAVFN